MDKSSIIGITLGVVCVSFVCWRASEGHLAMFYSEKGLIMVLGGTISVLFMAMPLSKLRQVPGYVKRFMFDRRMSLEQTVSTMNTLSEKARREGILSLESDLDTIDDSFLYLSGALARAGAPILPVKAAALRLRHEPRVKDTWVKGSQR